MLVSRDAMRAFGWILVLTLPMVGCQSAPEQIVSKGFTDDFGEAVPGREEITVESVQENEMLHQRAQLEWRMGGSFPFDLFDPGKDPSTFSFGENGPSHNSGHLEAVGGAKFQLESAKNIYFGLSADWTAHAVEPDLTGTNQIHAIAQYSRLSVLGNIDYDLPITEDGEGLLLRMGVGVGMTVIDFKNADTIAGQLGKVEDLYQIIIRPALGLRLPLSDDLLVFGELTYDIVPDRTLAYQNGAALGGEAATFSSGAVIIGISYQW